MKLNNRGWGYRMMAFLMSILITCLIIATVLIYRFYKTKGNDLPQSTYIEGQ